MFRISESAIGFAERSIAAGGLLVGSLFKRAETKSERGRERERKRKNGSGRESERERMTRRFSIINTRTLSTPIFIVFTQPHVVSQLTLQMNGDELQLLIYT